MYRNSSRTVTHKTAHTHTWYEVLVPEPTQEYLHLNNGILVKNKLVSILLHSIMNSFKKNPSASQDRSLAYVLCDAFGIAQ
jgi:hypothetical protein